MNLVNFNLYFQNSPNQQLESSQIQKQQFSSSALLFSDKILNLWSTSFKTSTKPTVFKYGRLSTVVEFSKQAVVDEASLVILRDRVKLYRSQIRVFIAVAAHRVLTSLFWKWNLFSQLRYRLILILKTTLEKFALFSVKRLLKKAVHMLH